MNNSREYNYPAKSILSSSYFHIKFNTSYLKVERNTKMPVQYIIEIFGRFVDLKFLLALISIINLIKQPCFISHKYVENDHN